MVTKPVDRRKVNKWRQKIFITVMGSVLASSGYVVFAAGKSAEKMEAVQKDVAVLEGFKTKSIVNAEQITQLSKSQEKTAVILDKINDRLLNIELKIEAQHRHRSSQ